MTCLKGFAVKMLVVIIYILSVDPKKLAVSIKTVRPVVLFAVNGPQNLHPALGRALCSPEGSLGIWTQSGH